MANQFGNAFPYFQVASRFLRIDFTADVVPDKVDIQLIEVGLETGVCAIFFDNGANANTVTLNFTDTGQSITLPKNSQGYIEILGASRTLNVEAIAAAPSPLRVLFIASPLAPAPIIWSVL